VHFVKHAQQLGFSLKEKEASIATGGAKSAMRGRETAGRAKIREIEAKTHARNAPFLRARTRRPSQQTGS
jgi:hypothetical protein